VPAGALDLLRNSGASAHFLLKPRWQDGLAS
jgi:hypothetical protein